jgi:hypothetical protein
VGEARGGPVERGLDLVPGAILNGDLILEPGAVQPGVPRGTHTTEFEQEGPSCV